LILMRQGRVVADGVKRDTLTPGALRDLFGVEVELAERNGYYHLW
jgi:iron complex transport system ATP-binding protein